MAELFRRDLQLTVGDMQISALDREGFDQPLMKVVFDIAKGGGKEPNKATISIWNLSKDSRGKVEERHLPVLLEAGYFGELKTLFSGDLTFGGSTRQGPDWVTKLESGDGTKGFKQARLNISFAKGVQMKQILGALGDAFTDAGLDPGNLIKKANEGGVRGLLKEFGNGVVLSGKASDIMDRVTKSLGYNWSIENGALQLLAEDEVTDDEAVVLNSASGLVGSPEQGEKGIVKARSLLNGDIAPGRKILLEGAELTGTFKTIKVVHSGDTWGNDWFSDMELKEI